MIAREKEQPKRRIHSGAWRGWEKPLGFVSFARMGGHEV
jgi:hypothetical protein